MFRKLGAVCMCVWIFYDLSGARALLIIVFFSSFTVPVQYSQTAPADALLPLCLKEMSHFLHEWPIRVASEKAIHLCLSL